MQVKVSLIFFIIISFQKSPERAKHFNIGQRPMIPAKPGDQIAVNGHILPPNVKVGSSSPQYCREYRLPGVWLK
jgi:hypothetical protein